MRERGIFITEDAPFPRPGSPSLTPAISRSLEAEHFSPTHPSITAPLGVPAGSLAEARVTAFKEKEMATKERRERGFAFRARSSG